MALAARMKDGATSADDGWPSVGRAPTLSWWAGTGQVGETLVASADAENICLCMFFEFAGRQIFIDGCENHDPMQVLRVHKATMFTSCRLRAIHRAQM